MYYTRCETARYPVFLVGDKHGLQRVHFDVQYGKKTFVLDGQWQRKDDFFVRAVSQLQEYFDGKRKTFALSVNPQGTAFQQCVWQALREIPFGQTRTYGEIARQIGKPKASRAVGLANAKNPLAVIIPCHRVIGANGSLTGFAQGLHVKEQLLRLEGACWKKDKTSAAPLLPLCEK